MRKAAGTALLAGTFAVTVLGLNLLTGPEERASGSTAFDYVSVLEYGAQGDDVADDTGEIQDALSAGKGPVYLPTGTYKISDTLLVPSGGGLIGPGTLHQTADVTTIANADQSNGNSNIRLEGFKIDKDYVNNSLADGIFVDHVTDLKIVGVEIMDLGARNGIEVRSSSNFLIRDCYLHDFAATGTGTLADGDPVSIDVIYVRSSNDGQVIGNRIENMTGTNNQSDGIYASNSTHLVIGDNRIKDVGEGIDIGATDHAAITGNVVDNAAGFGIKIVNGSSYNTITGNSVNDGGIAGISLARGTAPAHGNTEGNVISGNVILNSGWNTRTGGDYAGAGSAGIKVEGDSPTNYVPIDNLIHGNMTYDNQSTPTMDYGILEDDYAYDNTYADNVSVGHISGAIRLHP